MAQARAVTVPDALATVQQRTASESDRSALQRLIDQALGGTPYVEVPTYFLRLAIESKTPEARATVAEHDGDVLGFALIGEVAGSIGTGRIHFIGTTSPGRVASVDAMLCEAAVRDLTDRGARLVVAEVADDTPHASFRALLRACAFAEVGRVDDYYRDGVALVILARLTSHQPSVADG